MTYNTYCPDYPEPGCDTEQPVLFCYECEKGIYEGEDYYDFLGSALCERCLRAHKMTAVQQGW